MQNSSEGDQWADNLSKKDFDQYCKQQWLNMLGQQSWYLASSPLVPSQIYILALMLVPWSHLKYIFWSPWWCFFLFHCLQCDNGFREASTEGFQRKHPSWQVQVRFQDCACLVWTFLNHTNLGCITKLFGTAEYYYLTPPLCSVPIVPRSKLTFNDWISVTLSGRYSFMDRNSDSDFEDDQQGILRHLFQYI